MNFVLINLKDSDCNKCRNQDYEGDRPHYNHSEDSTKLRIAKVFPV